MLGEAKKCNEIINSDDWAAANLLFQLCIASLQNNIDEFRLKLKDAAAKKLVNITELYEWPIFHTMRENANYSDWIEEAFGYKLNNLRGLTEHKVLDFSPADTIKMFSEYFNKTR